MYRLSINGIVRLMDGANIPADTNNRDYADYLRWSGSGNNPEPAIEDPVIDMDDPDNENKQTRALLAVIASATGRPSSQIKADYRSAKRSLII